MERRGGRKGRGGKSCSEWDLTTEGAGTERSDPLEGRGRGRGGGGGGGGGEREGGGGGRSAVVRPTHLCHAFGRWISRWSRCGGARGGGDYTIPDSPRGTRNKSLEGRCRGRGEWNTYDVVCVDGVVKLAVNGKFVNGVRGAPSRRVTSAWNRKGPKSTSAISAFSKCPPASPRPNKRHRSWSERENKFRMAET